MSDGRKKFTEHDLLQEFARVVPAGSPRTRGVVKGIGDDTAVLRAPRGRDLLFTNDCQVEGRHFRRSWLRDVDIGWRLAAANLSDIAAMGGMPLYALVSLHLPRTTTAAAVHAVERGVRDHLARFGASIVGGNVSGTDGPLAADLALVGSVRTGRAWHRRCRPGEDVIVLVGTLGGARAGREMLQSRSTRRYPSLLRAFRKPEPLLDVAGMLTGQASVTGAIDVSDGFAADLVHVCRASRAGAEVELSALPVSRALRAYCRGRGRNPIGYALAGGEDYALILSVPRARAKGLVARIENRLGRSARVVGRFTRATGRYLVRDDAGRRMTLPRDGWDHLR